MTDLGTIFDIARFHYKPEIMSPRYFTEHLASKRVCFHIWGLCALWDIPAVRLIEHCFQKQKFMTIVQERRDACIYMALNISGWPTLAFKDTQHLVRPWP